MNKKLIKKASSVFEQIKRIDENGNEFWSARELSKVLDYVDYRNFLAVIEKAKTACKNASQNVTDHIVDFNDMVSIGSGAVREVDSVKLSRYACYLIVQNGDPSKEVIALGQTYFAVQSNELRRHNAQLADAAHNAGVIDSIDYAIFQNFGYKGLYGGLDAKAIHRKKQLKASQNILDHMGSTELAANLFRATQTEEKLRRENIKGKQQANETHYAVGKKVRQTIEELGGTMPEELPAAESIKKLEAKEKKKLK